MNYTQATDLIRSHTDYGGSVDVHALAVAMSEDAPAFGQTDAEALHDAWQSTFAHMDAVAVEPKLTVWYGSMPESNGKTNWTAILHNGDVSKGITVDRSEYPERVRYEADRMRWMIGELDKEPWISDYDTDKHSGYTATSSDWAPARIWLQREQGEGGSHTWCEDSVGDGDMIEEAEYMRIYTAPPAASGQMPYPARLLHESDASLAWRVDSWHERNHTAASTEAAAEPIWCQACGDGITAHDPGICGTCFAVKYRDTSSPSASVPKLTDDRILDEFERRCMSLRDAWGTPTLDGVRVIEGVRAILRASSTTASDKEEA